MVTVLVAFHCLHSKKKKNNLENGMFWNKATEGLPLPKAGKETKKATVPDC